MFMEIVWDACKQKKVFLFVFFGILFGHMPIPTHHPTLPYHMTAASSSKSPLSYDCSWDGWRLTCTSFGNKWSQLTISLAFIYSRRENRYLPSFAYMIHRLQWFPGVALIDSRERVPCPPQIFSCSRYETLTFKQLFLACFHTHAFDNWTIKPQTKNNY